MSTAPLFSIVTISFNQRKYLQQAIDSVLSQDSDLFEYLIMDGGSTDGSVELIEQIQDRLAFWQSCPDGGPSNALRSAVDHCKGRYLVYINSDDLLLPGAMRTLANYIGKYPDADVIYGHGVTFNETDGSITMVYSDRWGTRAFAKGLVSIFQQSCVHKLSAVREAGNFNPENRTCWDGELLFQMGRNGATFKRIDEVIGMFRIHEDSITGSQQTSDRYLQDRKEMAARVGVRTPLRGGLQSSILKLLRDPKLMVRKCRSRWVGPKELVVRGIDVRDVAGISR